MSNSGTWIANLGKDPEELTLGERQLVKLRCAEKAPGKKATTRWFTALVGGPDLAVAGRLRKGDCIALAGQMVRTEFKPSKGKNRGVIQVEDEMPFAKIMQVIKSPTFFGGGEGDAAADEPAFTPPADDDADDPLAGL